MAATTRVAVQAITLEHTVAPRPDNHRRRAGARGVSRGSSGRASAIGPAETPGDGSMPPDALDDWVLPRTKPVCPGTKSGACLVSVEWARFGGCGTGGSDELWP